jgi:hypothetical protein
MGDERNIKSDDTRYKFDNGWWKERYIKQWKWPTTGSQRLTCGMGTTLGEEEFFQFSQPVP